MMTEHESTSLQGRSDPDARGERPGSRRLGGVAVRTRGMHLAGILLMAVVFGVLMPGCKNDEGHKQRMTESSGQFTQGYEDGRRDAKNSWTDLHAGWMWLWMTDEQYHRGYDRGWADGRSEQKLRDKQKNHDAEQAKSNKLFGNDDGR